LGLSFEGPFLRVGQWNHPGNLSGIAGRARIIRRSLANGGTALDIRAVRVQAVAAMWKKKSREKLKTALFPPEWARLLEAHFPLYRRLSQADRAELEVHIQVFLAEKHFEGCGGLEVTELMKVTIAAQACLLLLHRKTDYYPGLRSILIYPSTFFATTTRPVGACVLEETQESRLGEAWESGAVVLAWDAVCQSTADPQDGHNLVFHEFAHQLDFEDGRADGAPVLPRPAGWFQHGNRYRVWARVLGTEYDRLQAKVATGQHSVIHEYGATNPAEFFAVATELFFERPLEMRATHPELYAELQGYYAQDPAQWLPSPGAGSHHTERL
jgi:MtfA peptidase